MKIPIYSFNVDELYSRKHVVAVVEEQIRRGKYRNPGAAWKWIEQIRNSQHEMLVWAPFGKSFGRSPMNPNAWRALTREPIWESKRIIDPVKWETLYFRPYGIVTVTWGTKHSFTAPLLNWIGRTVRIYDDDKIVEKLTPIRRDGGYLLLRKGDGTIGRFRVVEGKV